MLAQGDRSRHREHSTRTGANARSIGCCNRCTGGLLCPALTPYLQVGVFAPATRATQGFGVAHDASVIACEHSVVAGGTAIAAAVGGSSRVQRDGRAHFIQSDRRIFPVDRNKMWK